MADTILIEWTKGDPERQGFADVTVFEDGRVRLSPRLGGGEHQLSPDELQAVRRLVFDEQQFLKIEEGALEREVAAAAAGRRDQDSAGAVFVPEPQMDAGTTILRAGGTAPHEIRHVDLLGAAQSYPEVDALQRLRRIELKLIELAETLAGRSP